MASSGIKWINYTRQKSKGAEDEADGKRRIWNVIYFIS
jgi:hypothetical protein